MIRVLIADDHTILRDGLKQILAECPDLEVAGEADNGFDVIKKIREGEWDVLVLDMSMPGRSGIELIKQVKDERPKLPILILSMHKEDLYAVRSIRAGASGYLSKDSASSQLVTAIRKIASGGIYITPLVAERLAMQIRPASTAAPHTTLSDREYQIFLLLVHGKGITEIANELNLSVKTVSTHKARIMLKMEIDSLPGMVQYALKHKLLEEEQGIDG